MTRGEEDLAQRTQFVQEWIYQWVLYVMTIHLLGKEQTEMQLHLSDHGSNSTVVWLQIQEHLGRKNQLYRVCSKDSCVFHHYL